MREILKMSAKEMHLELSCEKMDAFQVLSNELGKWSARINLTSITNPKDIAIKHIIDSIKMAQLVTSGDHVLDIGSGAGFPALPIKIMQPDCYVVSVDSVGKKIHFQKHVARLLGLSAFEAIHARVESLHAQYAQQFTVITSRAFSRLELMVTLAAPMLEPGGRIIVMKGPALEDELSEDVEAIQSKGFEIKEICTYELPKKMGERKLITLMAKN